MTAKCARFSVCLYTMLIIACHGQHTSIHSMTRGCQMMAIRIPFRNRGVLRSLVCVRLLMFQLGTSRDLHQARLVCSVR